MMWISTSGSDFLVLALKTAAVVQASWGPDHVLGAAAVTWMLYLTVVETGGIILVLGEEAPSGSSLCRCFAQIYPGHAGGAPSWPGGTCDSPGKSWRRLLGRQHQPALLTLPLLHPG